jgi:hypothetical protein
MEELEANAIEVARRLLPDEPPKSRLFQDLKELCLLLFEDVRGSLTIGMAGKRFPV